MAAVKIQHKNCLQSTLRKKIINTLFAELGRSVFTIGKNCALGLGYSRPLAQCFPIRTSRPTNNIYIIDLWMSQLRRSLQYEWSSRSNNLLRIIMQWQRSIPKEDTKNYPLRVPFSNVEHLTLLFCRRRLANIPKLNSKHTWRTFVPLIKPFV